MLCKFPSLSLSLSPRTINRLETNPFFVHFSKQEKLKVKEATTDEKIFLLEQRRQHLIKQKGEIDTKLSDLHKRMKVRESGLTTR